MSIEWISVRDRLPEIRYEVGAGRRSAWVLTSSGPDDYEVNHLRVDSEDGVRCWYTDGLAHDESDITYWAVLTPPGTARTGAADLLLHLVLTGIVSTEFNSRLASNGMTAMMMIADVEDEDLAEHRDVAGLAYAYCNWFASARTDGYEPPEVKAMFERLWARKGKAT